MARCRCFDGRMPMSRHPIDPDGADAAINLAHEPAFGLAHATVTPAALSVAAAGWSQRLEPRAMQVLVVLARSAPAVVGRAELNMRAWNGRVVGDDAINRAVQLLRRVASDAPAPVPFMIETVPRVGYRLISAEGSGNVEDAPPAPALAATFPLPRPTRWRPVIWVGGAPALLAAILLWQGSVARDPAPAAWLIIASASIDDLPPGGNDVSLSPDGKRLAYRGVDASGRDRIFVRARENGGAGTPVSPGDLDAAAPPGAQTERDWRSWAMTQVSRAACSCFASARRTPLRRGAAKPHASPALCGAQTANPSYSGTRRERTLFTASGPCGLATVTAPFSPAHPAIVWATICLCLVGGT